MLLQLYQICLAYLNIEFCESDRAAYEKLSDDVPFELPKGWAWCKLNDVLLSLHTGLNPRQFFKLNTPDATNYYVTIRELKNNQVIFNNRTDRINNTALHLCNKRSNLEVGDILFGGTGSIGATAIVSAAPVNWNIKEGVYALKPNQKAILPHFLLYLLQAPTIKKLYMEQAVGATVLSVPMKEMNTLPIPLPPLAEQKQIVSRIEELFNIADKLGEAADELEAAAKRLDKKILDLAIRGKLMPQNPNDEPASELLKRIAATSHKSPCKNHETPIEPPFKIPKSWEWAKLGTISNYGQCRSVDAQSISAETWSLDLEEIEKETGRLIVRKTATDKKSTSSKHLFCKGMVLYSKLRTYLNKVLVADMDGVCTSEIVPISVATGIIPEFLRIVLMSPYFLQYTASKGYGVKMPRVGTNDMRESLIPIPPSAEQQRIVDRVKELKHIVALLSAP